MIVYGGRRRVLLAAGPEQEQPFRILFSSPILCDFQLELAQSFDVAALSMQRNPCEALLIHEDLFEAEGANGLTWLTRQREVPMIVIGGQNAEVAMRAYQCGLSQSLLREMALAHPSLMAAALAQARRTVGERERHTQTTQQLAHSRRHVDRLVGLIWRTAPAVDRDDHWFTQRHMMDRLQEELARRDRHGVPFTLAIGEVDADMEETTSDAKLLPEWASKLVGKAKRRCDVIGQYGMSGFMLLMVHTPKPGALTCCRRLQKILEQTAAEKTATQPAVRAYFGIAGSQSEATSAKSLLRCAEENLEMARTGLHDRIVADISRSAG